MEKSIKGKIQHIIQFVYEEGDEKINVDDVYSELNLTSTPFEIENEIIQIIMDIYEANDINLDLMELEEEMVKYNKESMPEKKEEKKAINSKWCDFAFINMNKEGQQVSTLCRKETFANCGKCRAHIGKESKLPKPKEKRSPFVPIAGRGAKPVKEFDPTQAPQSKRPESVGRRKIELLPLSYRE